MINSFLEKFENISNNNLHLYFITRVLKPNIKKSAKVLDKYDFEIYQVDIDSDITEHLYDITVKQLENVSKKNLEVSEYEAITDDTHQVFTYDSTNKGSITLSV